MSDLTMFTIWDEKCSSVAQVHPALLLKPVSNDDEEVKFSGPRLTIFTTHHINTSQTASAQLQ